MPSALAGTLLIALVYPLARRLRLAPRWALAALVLAASDTMLIAESRIGVLDPFVALWSAVCIYCALRYVQRGRPARWLVLTGSTGGLAVASKWSGALALLAAVAIVALDGWRARAAAAVRGRRRRRARRPSAARGAGGGRRRRRAARAAFCLVVPLAVYVASYAAYFASGHTVRQWLHLQGYMATFNWGVQGSSAMSSRPLTWIFDADPIWYRWALSPHGVLGLVAIGNPLLLWSSIAAFSVSLWLAARRRDPSLAAAPLLVAVLYLPWLATSRESYIYYLTPAIPFLAIAVAARRSPDSRPAAAAGARRCGGGALRAAGAVLVARPQPAAHPPRCARGARGRASPASWSRRALRGPTRGGTAPRPARRVRLAVRRRGRRPGRGLAAVPGLARRLVRLLRQLAWLTSWR